MTIHFTRHFRFPSDPRPGRGFPLRPADTRHSPAAASGRWRRPLAALAALAATCAVLAPATGAAAAPAAPPRSPGAATAGAVPVVGGVRLTWLPAGLGRTSDFTYDYDDVDFVSRVWESRIDGGWRVDLDVTVMRGARLSDGPALRDWFIDYEQRDPEPVYRAHPVHGAPGWACADQVFWLARPGLAVSVHLDGSRWRPADVARIAASAVPPAR